MAAITIKGIRINSISIDNKKEPGEELITSEYAIISSADKVIANQSVGGYNGLKLQPSPATIKALNEFIKLYKQDISIVIGLETE